MTNTETITYNIQLANKEQFETFKCLVVEELELLQSFNCPNSKKMKTLKPSVEADTFHLQFKASENISSEELKEAAEYFLSCFQLDLHDETLKEIYESKLKKNNFPLEPYPTLVSFEVA